MTEKLKRFLRSAAFRKVRKVVVLIVGSVVLLAGVALLFLPGPAFVVIPTGFAILATEFEWARRWAQKSMEWLRSARDKVKRRIAARRA